MINFISKKYIIVSLGVVVLGVLAWVFLGSNGGGIENIEVKRSDLEQKVVVTGKVKAYGEVDLGFDAGGRIARSFAEVGDKVGAGDTIAVLDLAETLANLAKERAILDQELAKLEEVKNNAPASVSQAKANLNSAVLEGYAAMDNAVRNKIDQFFKTPRNNPVFEISITDGNFVHYFPISADTAIDLNNQRRFVENMLNQWQATAINNADLSTMSSKMINDMNVVSGFLDKISLAVNSFTPDDYSYEATVTGYKTAVDSARSAVSSARGKIITAEQNISSSPIVGSTGVISSIAEQEAKVSQEQLSIAALEAAVSKSSITAPFSGIITRQDAKVGETAKSGEPLVSLVSQEMYIEANVSEINIGKVSVGNQTTITFDAFPEESFGGVISFIEPGETIVDSVVNYKVRINSAELDERVKVGLTANVEIETWKKENVLAVPAFAIIKEAGQSYVSKLEGGSAIKTPITTGAEGSNGLIEVLSGLNEGDIVQTLIKN